MIEDVRQAAWDAVATAWRRRVGELEPMAEATNERNADDPSFRPRSGVDLMLEVVRDVWLREIDVRWREHLQAMEALRERVGLHAYGFGSPTKEYGDQALELFTEMMETIDSNVVSMLFRIQIDGEP